MGDALGFLDDDELLMLTWASINALEATLPAPRESWRDPARLLDGSLWLQLIHWRNLGRVDEWRYAIGASPATFKVIVLQVQAEMEHTNDYNKSRQMGVEERVAIAMYKLHNGVSNKVCEHVFKTVADNTVGVITLKFVKALVKTKSRWIHLPDDAELAEIALAWEQRPNSRLTNCVMAVDGTHITLASSDLGNRNYKKYDSFLCLAAVDHKYRLRYWLTGLPGAWSDKNALEISRLRKFACPVDANGRSSK